MTHEEYVASLEQRITQEEEKREHGRASGPFETYLEAYSMVEALEIPLEHALCSPRATGNDDLCTSAGGSNGLL